ncbi:hypothetical protein HGP28_12510 [Vibrio sp. SM6]|uniref:Uncharacterized protein n=1 Tax=Vibrio agarilyticus TaxID=2726741 RepID=A0A7X8TRU4_9VIBR|nr:hypothetical protein [Vibrio agarilyticus]NLS13715.1 hypothetical protein [Vibrio agarilyticus]
MQTDSLATLFRQAATVYSYGDHITGDMLLVRCIALYSKLYEVQHQQQTVLEQLAEIRTAREAFDFSRLADILRYQILPALAVNDDPSPY